MRGLRVELLDLGRRVRISNSTGSEITVVGVGGMPDVHVAAGKTVAYADPRTRWGGPTPAAVRAHPRTRQVVATWTIPVRGAATVAGRILWVPPPPATPWIAMAVVLFLVTVGVAMATGRLSWPGWLSARGAGGQRRDPCGLGAGDA